MAILPIVILISYLIGSIPTAYIFGKTLKGIDIRRHGSGNVGATNALRVLGRGPGLVCLILDVLKGVLPVVFLGKIAAAQFPVHARESIYIAVGISSICGHTWTVFLNFKGGKGIATTLGVLIGLAISFNGILPIIGLLLVVWGISFAFTKIVSISSIISAIALPLLMLAFKQSLTLIAASTILSVFVIIRHKSNITRLMQGKENKLKF
jgi:glycerol-3-phosphate acyltransferase PlsY